MSWVIGVCAGSLVGDERGAPDVGGEPGSAKLRRAEQLLEAPLLLADAGERAVVDGGDRGACVGERARVGVGGRGGHVERELAGQLLGVALAQLGDDLLVVAEDRLERVVGDPGGDQLGGGAEQALPSTIRWSRNDSGRPGSSASIQSETLHSSTAIGLRSTP